MNKNTSNSPKEKLLRTGFVELLFPENVSGNAWWLLTVLAGYVFISFLGILYHEMWRDELEPWLVASDSENLSDFFHNMQMGSNPYLWYLLLHFVSKISFHPVVIQFTHLLFAAGAVYLFLRFAPFSFLQKLIFCFGYYILFEYGIISRGYALTIFFLFLFCALYRKYWAKTLPLAIITFFLANATGGFGVIFSVSFLVFLLSNYFFKETPLEKKTVRIKQWGWTALFIIFSVWVAMKSITPPQNSVYASNWFTEMDSQRMQQVLWRVWTGFVPLPQLSSNQFWNTNILIDKEISSATGKFLSLVSLAILFFNTLLFSRKISVLLFYLSGTFGILLFSYLSGVIFYINGARYNGYLYIIFIVSCWLLYYFPEKKKIHIPFLTFLREKLLIEKWKNHLLIFFLAVNFLAGIFAYAKDFFHPFSSVEATGTYILKNNLTRFQTAGCIDYTVSPITAYTQQPVYYPDRDTTSTFPIWRMTNYVTDMNQVMNRLLSYISSKTDTVLVILNFDIHTTVIGNVFFIPVASFSGSIVSDENYWLYLAKEMNMQDIDALPETLTPAQATGYLAMAYQLLQQNKTDDCENLLKRISEKTIEKNIPRLHTYLGMVYARKNLFLQASSEFKKEITKDLQKDEAYMQWGMLYYNLQNADSAIYCWEQTILLNPNNVEAYNNLGVCHLNFKKNIEEAERCWKKAIEINPNFLQVFYNLMTVCQNKKDEQCLLKYLKIVLSKGVPVNEIRNRGINISDELLKKAIPS